MNSLFNELRTELKVKLKYLKNFNEKSYKWVRNVKLGKKKKKENRFVVCGYNGLQPLLKLKKKVIGNEASLESSLYRF